MKKILFLIFILIIACTPQIQEDTAKEVMPEIEKTETSQPAEQQLPDQVQETIETSSEPVLFDPVLTYDGAYNGPLYATSEQIGNYENKDIYMNNLKRNGVNFFIGMFPVLGQQSKELFASNADLGYIAELAIEYPGMVIPFYGSGFGGEQLNNFVSSKGSQWIKLYTDVLDTYQNVVPKDFIRGFGEVETQEWDIQHNHPTILKLASLAEQNNFAFMFHPVAKKISGVKDLIEKYPNTNFLIHMFREDLRNSETQLIDIMKTHDNLFFSIDAAHIIHLDGNDILYSYHDKYKTNAKNNFISDVNRDYNKILNSALNEYKNLVNSVPDKVMWGTEAGPKYSFDPQVYDLMVKMSRDFIAKVTTNTDNQEALAYKNALRVFGHGITLSSADGLVYSTSWPTCNDELEETCSEECNIEDEGDHDSLDDPNPEICENQCYTRLQCIDVVEED